MGAKHDEGVQDEHAFGVQKEMKPIIPLVAIVIGVALTVLGLLTDSHALSIIVLLLALLSYWAGLQWGLEIIAVALTGNDLNVRQDKALESVVSAIV